MANGNVFEQLDNQQPPQDQTYGQAPPNMFQQLDQQAAQNSQPTGQGGMTGLGGFAPKQGTFMDMVDIMNRNFAAVGNGGLQLAAQGLSQLGLDTSWFQNQVAKNQAMHERDYQQAMQNSPSAGLAMDIGSKIGAAVATPGVQPFLAASAPTVLERVGQSALAGGIAGGEEYTPENESRIENALTGAATGAVLQSGLEGLGALASKGASKLFNTPVQEAAETADKGLLTTMGTATGNPVLQGAESMLGRIPVVGSRGRIQAQEKALQGETADILGSLGLTGKENRISLGGNLNEDLLGAYKQATAKTNVDYNAAAKIGTEQNVQVPLTNAISEAQQAIDNLGGLSEAGFKSLKPGRTTDKASALLQDFANLPKQTVNAATGEAVGGNVSAAQFEDLRKGVSSLIDDLYTGNGDKSLAQTFSAIKGAMDQDLDVAAQANPTYAEAIQKARNTFQTEKAPFLNSPDLAKFISGKMDTDQLLNSVIKNDRPILTQTVMKALGPERQQQFTKAIVNRAVDKAIIPDNTAAGAHLDLNQFNDQLYKLGDTIKALPQMEQDKLAGLQRLITRGSELIETAKTNPRNATSLTTAVGGALAGSTLGLLPLIKMAGAAKVVSYAMTSPKITKALIKLAGGKLAQTGEDGLIKSTLKVLQRGVIPAASAAMGNKPMEEK